MWCSGTARSPSRSAAPLPWTRSSPVPPDFRGKVALVTGVGRVGQIGQAVARGLGGAGAPLVIVGFNALAPQERGEGMTAPGGALRGRAGGPTTPRTARPGGAAAQGS